MLRKLLSVVLCVLILPFCAFAMERDEIRVAYSEIIDGIGDNTLFASEPDIISFENIGSPDEGKVENALDYVNFLRRLAGLDPVAINPLYTVRAQHAVCLLAANDKISHSPEKCAGMPDAMYETAYAGAEASNLACLTWVRPQIMLEGISYFERDDGANNATSLPHRRWLLNPQMAETGFGLAISEKGNSYVAMYAVDSGNVDVDWEYVAWPAAGTFPAELMRANLAWSVSLPYEVYDPDTSRPKITLVEAQSSTTFEFEATGNSGDGTAYISREPYGSGWCIIFTPDFSGSILTGYEQNQRWNVRISNLRTVDGRETAIEYTCEMISLNVQRAANVEVYPREVSMRVGEQKQLTAAVIPEYADDRSVIWTSDAPEIVNVDANGQIAAVAAGTGRITAETADGAVDTCFVTVE